jgi:nitroimidazol reductase NimA-like FMN-containing flavoprotein (pyridoxamine 5'-phosphate oxidase superfamily)
MWDFGLYFWETSFDKLLVMASDCDGLGTIARAECLSLLASRSVGRIALSRHALPVIVPVIYDLDGSDIVFCTGSGSKAPTIAHKTVIAFEVDDINQTTRSGWSVLVAGIALRIARDHPGWRTLQASGLRPWDSHVECLIRLSTDHLSGHRCFDCAVSDPFPETDHEDIGTN